MSVINLSEGSRSGGFNLVDPITVDLLMESGLESSNIPPQMGCLCHNDYNTSSPSAETTELPHEQPWDWNFSVLPTSRGSCCKCDENRQGGFIGAGRAHVNTTSEAPGKFYFRHTLQDNDGSQLSWKPLLFSCLLFLSLFKSWYF